MNYFNWYNETDLISGTSLKHPEFKQDNNLALHTTDNAEEVIENRKRLAEEIQVPLEQFVFANQTHSTNIHKVTKDDIGAGAFSIKDAIPDCDALYTTLPNVVLGVFTADCVPILLFDKEQRIIAAVHAGWQGTVNELLKKMLDILIYEEDSHPNEILAYIGPSIEFFNYEVDDKVIEKVKAMSFDTSKFWMEKDNGKYLVDLKMINHQMLIDAKIPDTNIFIHNWDTYEEEEYLFSYRKHKDSGRNLSFIMQK